MKSFAEQVADLKATRESKTDEMKTVARASVDGGRSMDTAEQERFDTLQSEVKRLDDDIKRLSVLAELDAKTAAPVDQKHTSDRTPVQIRTPQEKREKGIGFARLARIKALTQIDRSNDPLQVARALYPADEELHSVFTKGNAIPAANTSTATWAGNLILDGGAIFTDFVEFLRANSLLGQISGRLRRIPFDTQVLVQATAGSASWVAEGAAKPLTQWTYTRAKLEPLKVAAIAAATKEMLGRASTAADALIRDELARAVNATIDGTFIGAAGGGSGVAAGIRNTITATTLPGATAGGAEAVRCDAATMMKMLVSNNQSLSGCFWVMPETVAVDLATMINPMGAPAFPGMTPTGGTFMGMPAFASQYVPVSDTDGSVVMLVKGDEIFLGDEGGVEVSMSDQASLLMDDAPQASMKSATTPAGASVVSMWQTNSVAFLVERTINWQRRRTQSLVWGYANWDDCA
jgi:HK97 family phage major capsid protein